MAKATEQTTGDTATDTPNTPEAQATAPAPEAAKPKSPKAAPHPWDAHKSDLNGLTIYNFTAKPE